MVALGQVVAWGVLVAVAGGFAWLGATTYRRREGPGMASFAGYCVLLAVTLAGFAHFQYFDGIVGEAGTGQYHPAMLAATILTFFSFQAAGLVAPMLWIRHTLSFTGQEVPTTRRTTLLIAAPALVAVGCLVLFIAFPLVWVGLDLGPMPDFPAELIAQYVLGVAVFYMASLLIAGAALIAWTSYTYRHLSTRGGALLAVGCTLPWAALAVPIVAGFFEEQPGLLAGHAALGALVGGLAVAAAVHRHDFFASVPAAGTIGRSVTVASMDTPVLVVDEDGRLVDQNAAAMDLLGTTPSAIGTRLESVVDWAGSPADLVSGEPRVVDFGPGNRVIEATGSALRDEYDRTVGYSIVCHDVTDRTRREQRIGVLNRVLRHNLRNEMSVVDGYAELLQTEAETTEAEMPETYADEIRKTTTKLIAIGEKAREIERILATGEDPSVAPVETVVSRAVEEVRGAYPACSFSTAVETDGLRVDETTLHPIVRELVENGAAHTDAADPSVTVRVTPADGDRVTIEVSDNGPGIPEHELTPIRAGAETDLDHGSGLGLWLVSWGLATVGGTVEFGTAEPRGTTVTVTVPTIE